VRPLSHPASRHCLRSQKLLPVDELAALLFHLPSATPSPAGERLRLRTPLPLRAGDLQHPLFFRTEPVNLPAIICLEVARTPLCTFSPAFSVRLGQQVYHHIDHEQGIALGALVIRWASRVIGANRPGAPTGKPHC